MKIRLCLLLALVVCGVSLADAGNVSPVQSKARPFGLQPYAPVMKSGSDSRSRDFNRNFLPSFLELVDQQLAEQAIFTGRDGFRLDARRLFLRTESDAPIRVYFICEGAGYHNSLGFSMTPAGSDTPGSPHLVFPDASFKGLHSKSRSKKEPLIVGDFVDLSTGGPGIQLDFFCIADGANHPVATWFNNQELNADGQQHVVAFLLPGSRYVLIGFEDLWNGGDFDYNDCLFVVDVGEVNAENLFDDSTLPH